MSTVPSETPSSQALAPDRQHPAFEWLRSTPIPSLNLVIEEYRHRATGAQHFHLAADNPENVFLVAVRTVPTDSTGVAHILEHTVLCGSERYPVRDPFFMMTRRSLNTFMNAFTSSDWTAYPFASENRKDFGNLMDVYLDAAFFARLDPLDFAQEGHRLEFSVPDDPDSDLVYKGVVYNEMKGAMSSPVNMLWHSLSAHLFPTTTYHYNSGGEPEHIPDLSYDDLKAFYATHYHPSNAVFMTYGDIPAYDHHHRMEERALSRFEHLDEHIAVDDERRYAAPLAVEEYYADDDAETNGKKTHIVMGWLLGHSTDLAELLQARLLDSVLLDNSASPLRHALETCGLGSAPSPLCGLEDSNREMSFICGIEGSTAEQAEALEALVLEVLERVATEGIPQQRLEAVLHQLELQQREIGGDSYPYGLQLILDSLSPAIHRGDPVALLNLDPVLEKLRQDIQDPDFIKRLVRELLLDNPHRVRLTMKPDPHLSARREQRLAERLAAVKAGLDDRQKQAIVTRARLLDERQNGQDDPGVLPKVGLGDIPVERAVPAGMSSKVGGRPLTVYEQGTNGLAYQQVVVDMPAIPDELLQLLPYYTSTLTMLGCDGRDYLETQSWQYEVSGGVNAYTSVRAAIDDEQNARGHFVLSGKALVRNHRKLGELLRRTLDSVRHDELRRLRELISQQRAQQERSITGAGHSFAMLAASSGMSPVAALSHRLRGLEGIRFLKQLDESLDDDARVDGLAQQLQRIKEIIVAAPAQFLLIGESEHRTQLQDELTQTWSDMPGATGYEPLALPPTREPVRQMWLTNTQVNFCAKAYPTVPMRHPDAAALTVLGGFLRNGYLHRAVREQGGAYGGGATHDPGIAAFRFFSYRDPRLVQTLDDFDKSVAWLLDERHESRQVEEAVLGVISALDKPGSPAGEAKDAFYDQLYGRTPKERNAFRARVLAVTLDDLRRVGAAYLRPDRASTAVVTSAAALEQYGDLGLQINKL